MNRPVPKLIVPSTVVAMAAILAALAILAGGCGKREGTSPLYVLEELEAATALKNPDAKVERLEIFIGEHASSPYRFIAYRRAYETLAGDLKNGAKAEEFLDAALAKETDVEGRGELLLDRFEHLMETDRGAAILYADTLFERERSPRLFLFLGYDLMDPKADPDRAVKCFLRSADLTVRPYAKAHAVAMAAYVLDEQGKREEAKRYLGMAEGDPEADGLMGKILWDEGRREEALGYYIRSAAGMPGAREYDKLDSLYAIVHPGARDLDEKIMALRIVDAGPMPDGVFVDLDGRAYDLSKLKGTKVVIEALSPT
jgi:tetratricopeptide (TPR) repeat protein